MKTEPIPAGIAPAAPVPSMRTPVCTATVSYTHLNNVFVYTKPSMDITPTVMKELNKDAPAGFDPTKKKTPAVPAAPAAPAK